MRGSRRSLAPPRHEHRRFTLNTPLVIFQELLVLLGDSGEFLVQEFLSLGQAFSCVTHRWREIPGADI